MELSVRDVCQSASSGSYVVKYRAEISLTSTDDDITVTVASFSPASAPADLVKSAADAIREGFADVLSPRNQGATVVLHDLAIHEVDFNIYKFTQCSADALRASIEGK